MSNVLIQKSSLKPNSEAKISGSKSIANRALMVASIAKGETEISNLPQCDDVSLLLDALLSLGVKIEKISQDCVKIFGNNGIFNDIKNPKLFCKIAGTTSRFLSSLALLSNGSKLIIDGEGRLLERPIDGLCDGLSLLGCDINFLNRTGCVPFEIQKTRENPDSIELDASVSGQFLSSILMVAPRLKNGLEILPKGKAASQSYINLTIDLMKSFGASVVFENEKYFVKNQEYIGREYVISGDFSSGSYFFALPLLLSGSIDVSGLDINSKQGDFGVLKILEKIGCKVFKDNDKVSIKSDGKLRPIEVNMENMPDSAMTIASVLIFADGISKITGLKTLKNKETDRLLALHTEFLKIGIITEIDNNSITIFGNSKLKNNEKILINTYHDHRIAMCFAIIGAKIGGLEIENSAVVSKSMPEFWDVLSSSGIDFSLC